MVKHFAIPACERAGLCRQEAAEYVGVSATLFDQMVGDGRMPRAKMINSRKVWHRLTIDEAFAHLPNAGQYAAPHSGQPDFVVSQTVKGEAGE